jgi:hypothetical protein
MSKPHRPADHPRQLRAGDLGPGATSACIARPGDESAELLPQARLEALAGLFPGWRIWLDGQEWHARRRSDGFVQDYQPGAPAFHVSADSAMDLAAQLCWQHAAERHAPGGCEASRGWGRSLLAAAGAY